MEKIIIYKPAFEFKIQELIQVLFEEKYFGFVEFAVEYVEKIYEYVYDNIDSPIVKSVPSTLQEFGKFYLKYKANRQTTWYVFFDYSQSRYLINYIFNNHSPEFLKLK